MIQVDDLHSTDHKGQLIKYNEDILDVRCNKIRNICNRPITLKDEFMFFSLIHGIDWNFLDDSKIDLESR